MGIFKKEQENAAHRLQGVTRSPAAKPPPVIPKPKPALIQTQGTAPAELVPELQHTDTIQQKTKNKIYEKKKKIKEKATKIKKAIEEQPIVEADMGTHKNATEYQEVLDVEAEIKEHRKQRAAAIRGRMARIAQKLGILLCAYMLFLICGAIVTQYAYDPVTGELKPQVMTIDELAAAGEFQKLQNFYIRARNIYEDVLALDFKLANNPNQALLIASEYEVLLDGVSKLVVDINAASFQPQYNQIYRQLLNWVQTDVAIYIQYVSAAVATNDDERAIEAIFAREMVYNNFLSITENLEIFGKSVKGANLGDIYEWSPEKVLTELGGFVYE